MSVRAGGGGRTLMVAPLARQARGFILVVLLLAPTPLLAQGSVAAVGVTFVPNSYDGESFVPAAGAWETVGRGATRLHFDHMVSSPDNRMSTVLTPSGRLAAGPDTSCWRSAARPRPRAPHAARRAASEHGRRVPLGDARRRAGATVGRAPAPARA